ncbi:helix-turn-helix transcriptional regulator [Pedobacter cryotolerans]|uniref:Helix-turn-helix domain-containing protein n=1 Tax=Pedobacter cryotolerans TaxID=2571270 RepID=A0A4U1C7N5_9SPHI|nr:helix-turn-helix domain-containing protein [Pedobacter cryotolerans]TKC01397.1 helix-turn-helix domain-containing protein [Pedobacter cryotolerans]
MDNTHSNTLERIEALLLNQKQILNIDEFCRYTGFSKSFAYKLTSAKRLPFSCPNGKLIFFRKPDVDNFLLANPVSSTDDINQQAIDYVNNISSQKGKKWKD